MTAILGPLIGSAAVTVGRGAAAAAGDGLSFAAELLRAVGGQSPESAETSGDDAPQDELLQRIGAFADRIRQHLAAAGIELSQPLELVSDGLGGIGIAGSHPQQSVVEAVLGGDVLLERDFDRLAEEYDAMCSQCATGELPAAFSVVVPAA
jgi:hypothetical protein